MVFSRKEVREIQVDRSDPVYPFFNGFSVIVKVRGLESLFFRAFQIDPCDHPQGWVGVYVRVCPEQERVTDVCYEAFGEQRSEDKTLMISIPCESEGKAIYKHLTRTDDALAKYVRECKEDLIKEDEAA